MIVHHISMAMSHVSEILPFVVDTASSLGYADLREQQKDAILAFLEGNDVFVALPTGYGKSLCYGCLAWYGTPPTRGHLAKVSAATRSIVHDSTALAGTAFWTVLTSLTDDKDYLGESF